MKTLVSLALLGLMLSTSAFASTPSAPTAKPVVKHVLVSATAPPQAVLTYTAPTANTDGSAIVGAITYNVYQGTSAASLAKVQSGLTALTATITSGPGIADGATAFFAVSATVGGVESAQSNVGSKTFSVGTPNAPTLVVQ